MGFTPISFGFLGFVWEISSGVVFLVRCRGSWRQKYSLHARGSVKNNIHCTLVHVPIYIPEINVWVNVPDNWYIVCPCHFSNVVADALDDVLTDVLADVMMMSCPGHFGSLLVQQMYP